MERIYILIRIYIGGECRRELGKHCNILNSEYIQFISEQRSNRKSLHMHDWGIKPTGVENQGSCHVSVMGQEDPTAEIKETSPSYSLDEGYSYILELRNGKENRARDPVSKDEDRQWKFPEWNYCLCPLKWTIYQKATISRRVMVSSY